MKFVIIWSEFAQKQLDEIYDFYSQGADTRTATKLILRIINVPNKLLKSPLIGQRESLLKERTIEYRYLVFKNYKIIYSVDSSKGFIKISDVFDTRQNPSKLKRTH